MRLNCGWRWCHHLCVENLMNVDSRQTLRAHASLYALATRHLPSRLCEFDYKVNK